MAWMQSTGCKSSAVRSFPDQLLKLIADIQYHKTDVIRPPLQGTSGSQHRNTD